MSLFAFPSLVISPIFGRIILPALMHHGVAFLLICGRACLSSHSTTHESKSACILHSLTLYISCDMECTVILSLKRCYGPCVCGWKNEMEGVMAPYKQVCKDMHRNVKLLKINPSLPSLMSPHLPHTIRHTVTLHFPSRNTHFLPINVNTDVFIFINH